MKDIKIIISVIATAISSFLGGFDVPITILLTAIVIDYITGIVVAVIQGNLNSKVGFRGLLKKVLYLFVVGVAVMIDKVSGSGGAVRDLIIYYFVSNECLSILENCGNAGIPLPQILKDKLVQIQNKTTNKTENATNTTVTTTTEK